MKKIILPLIIIALITGWQWHNRSTPTQQPATLPTPTHAATTSTNFEYILQQAYQNQQSNIQIQGEGIVSKILPDDNKGSRHQRFILKLNNGQTLLIAHNIDLAPKLQGLKKGDTVAFYGEYEWNKQGGVIHWTHKDPHQHHTDGWLRYQNQLYQ